MALQLASNHDEPAISDGAAAAEEAALVYCSDTGPGISRVKSGKGVRYVLPGGSAAPPRTVDRINALAIPPAWTDVWIAPRTNCHIQATGRDVRGRKQYKYHADWTAFRDDVKFANLAEFARALPKLRKAVEADLRQRGMPRDKVLATIVWLIDRLLIRVGNDDYMRSNGSFGLTTLRDRHAKIAGGKLRLAFKGKSGKEWDVSVDDRRIARVVKTSQDLPGQRLFQYVGDDGERHNVSSGDVNDYLRRRSGSGFTSKHFRTWGATVMAAAEFAAAERPDSETARKRLTNEIVDRVARRLCNTRTVCRKNYIHPMVPAAWSDGKLADELATRSNRETQSATELSAREKAVLRWLEANGSGKKRKAKA